MLQWCRRGSPASHVSHVEVAWETPEGERGFQVRH